MRFKSGAYSGVNELVATISQTMGSAMTLKFEENIVQCTLHEDGFVHFSDYLCNMLGFRRESIQRRETKAVHACDLYPGMNCVLVLTNFIEESPLGDQRVPLLRLLPFRQTTPLGDVLSYNCYPIQYKRVVHREINCIRIILSNYVGRKLPFVGVGRVSMTLHFRKRQ